MLPKLNDFGLSVAEIFHIKDFLIWNFLVTREDTEDGW